MNESENSQSANGEALITVRNIQSTGVTAAQKIHRSTQRSQTLKRQYLSKKDLAPKFSTHPAKASSANNGAKRLSLDGTSRPGIQKFAPKPKGGLGNITVKHIDSSAPKVAAASKPRAITVSSSQNSTDIPPTNHPMLNKALQHQTARAKRNAPKLANTQPSQVIKQQAIAEALDKAPAKSSRKEYKAPRRRASIPQKLSLASASLAILLLGGYFTYLNMPHLSIKVAAAQAGIDAKYPNYQPSGYSLSGPVAYRQGEVNMKFVANAGPQSFTISQTKSTWDSDAVLENYVEPKAGKKYVTNQDNGLTIYTYGENAAWVNNGILYSLNGDAPLSGEQIRHIATSM